MVFQLRSGPHSQAELNLALSQYIGLLNATTQPKSTTHFPKDLDIVNNVLESLVNLLYEESIASVHTVFN